MSDTTEDEKKISKGARGECRKTSPSALERYLKGIAFLVDKNDLIKRMRGNSAPNEVMYVLNQFREEEFHSAIDATKESEDIK